VWVAFHDFVEERLGSNGAMELIRGLANKLPEHSVRLAAILTLAQDLEAGEIPKHTMAQGIELAHYYANEALRIYASSKVSADLKTAEHLLNWLQTGWSREKGNLISVPDIYQHGPSAIRDSKVARRMVAILLEHGWLHSAGRGEIQGKSREEVYRIVGEGECD
jgi:hypothetical protein